MERLERQVARDSGTSSKPPSSDSPYKKKPPRDRSLREKGKRVPGKQPGVMCAPVIAATRLRGGNAASARGAAGFAARALASARACGATGTIVARMDSGFYTAAVIAAIRRSRRPPSGVVATSLF